MRNLKIKRCRICGSNKITKILNLGHQPLANNLLSNKKKKEKKIPLILIFCKSCSQAQLSHNVDPGVMFKKYVWVTGTSDGAQKHSKVFYNYINNNSKYKIKRVLEIASNDGTFLKRFKKKKGLCIGVDPAKNIARIANAQSIKTYPSFFNFNFSNKLKKKYSYFDLIYARNVFPHVPKPQELLKGFDNLMNDSSTGVIEFHYSGEILRGNQYDSIYHEHYFYYSLKNIKNLLRKHKFHIYHIEPSPISGGSLIVFFSKKKHTLSKKAKNFFLLEKKSRFNSIFYWKKFAKLTIEHKKKIIHILSKKKKIIAYGASARSSTFLNFCNINNSKIRLICDKNKYKQEKYSPGSKILIKNPDEICWKSEKYLIILSWNFFGEIKKYLIKKNFKGKILKPFPNIEEINI